MDDLLETAQESHDAPAGHGHAPFLYVVLEAERPLARGARYSLAGVDEILIGRGPTRSASRSVDGRLLEVRIRSPWMSSCHVRLHRDDGGWTASDPGSRNGTFLGDRRIETANVGEGDWIEAGHTFFTLGEGLGEGLAGENEDEDAERSVDPFGLRTLLLPLRERLSTLLRVAEASASPILLLGPTGSGKEVVARAVHASSGRTGDFVAVNCGALPASLVEGLLFGHVRGAFSGALREEIGFVRAAHGGTLFLDEIGDLPAHSQATLLRVLQEGEVVPVGSTRPVRVDLRVIAATHRPIERLAASGAFRSDLLARLRGFTHRLPPLAERLPDLGLILGDILARVAGENAGKYRLALDAARALMRHDWPLNVRELHQCVVACVAIARGGLIEARDLPEALVAPRAPRRLKERKTALTPRPVVTPRDSSLKAALDALLTEHHGNVAAVARSLRKAPAQIHRWMKRLGVDPTGYRILRKIRRLRPTESQLSASSGTRLGPGGCTEVFRLRRVDATILRSASSRAPAGL